MVSILQALARELYALEREVEKLTRELASAPPERREEIEDRLRRTKAERDQLRGRIEAKKEPPTYRTKFR